MDRRRMLPVREARLSVERRRARPTPLGCFSFPPTRPENWRHPKPGKGGQAPFETPV